MPEIENIAIFLEKNFPNAFQFFGILGGNADVYTHDRVERTIEEEVAETRPEKLQKIIVELESILQEQPIDYERLALLINYNLNSDAEAQDLLIRLRDGLRDGLAARMKTEKGR
jgi:hypothetical protein